MAKLLLLLFLLVAVGSTIAWPSYSDDAEQDSLSAEQEMEDRRHAVANYHSDTEMATFEDNADTANEDMDMTAYNQHDITEINGRCKRWCKRCEKPG
jgi:Tfp pilus assembly protein PilE